MNKSAKSRKPAEKKGVVRQPAVFYRVNALLHTIRHIEQHEDQLCTILNEIKTSGAVSKELNDELRTLLDEMPSTAYQGDLEALRAALDA